MVLFFVVCCCCKRGEETKMTLLCMCEREREALCVMPLSAGIVSGDHRDPTEANQMESEWPNDSEKRHQTQRETHWRRER